MRMQQNAAETSVESNVDDVRKVSQELGDFTTTWNVIPISGLAIGIGIFSAFVALALLRLIGIFTNLFFFQRWGTALVSPAGNRLGWLEVFVPMIGRPDYRRDGALWLGTHSRARHSRGHRSHSE